MPALALFGGLPSNSFAEVTDDFVRLKFGPPFDQRIPREMIQHAGPTKWPFLGGIGWRVARGQTIGLIGALKDNVELTLREPMRLRFFGFPKQCRRIVVTLRDPTGFLAQLGGVAEGHTRRA